MQSKTALEYSNAEICLVFFKILNKNYSMPNLPIMKSKP